MDTLARFAHRQSAWLNTRISSDDFRAASGQCAARPWPAVMQRVLLARCGGEDKEMMKTWQCWAREAVCRGGVLVAICLGAGSAWADPTEAVRQVLMQTWDRPQAPLVVDPVVVEDGYALAGWTQQDRGGIGLLRQLSDGQWQVTLCGGDGLSQAAALRQGGVPDVAAEHLATRFAQAQDTIDPQRRALFSTFGATVRMDGAAH